MDISNLTEQGQHLIDRLENGGKDGLAEGITTIFQEVTKHTILITALAHERHDDLNRLRMEGIHEKTVGWLVNHYVEDYGEHFLVNIQPAFRRLILFVRDETEFALGVRERPEKRTVYK